MAATVSIAVNASEAAQGIVNVGFGKSLSIRIPKDPDASFIEIAKKDIEIVSGIIGERPEDVISMMSHARSGDFEKASDIARKLDLTESRFVREGGGIWVLIGVIAVVAVLTLASDSPTPSREGAGDGGADAGAG